MIIEGDGSSLGIEGRLEIRTKDGARHIIRACEEAIQNDELGDDD
jgi:hypothetical protein